MQEKAADFVIQCCEKTGTQITITAMERIFVYLEKLKVFPKPQGWKVPGSRSTARSSSDAAPTTQRGRPPVAVAKAAPPPTQQPATKLTFAKTGWVKPDGWVKVYPSAGCDITISHGETQWQHLLEQ